MKFITTTLAIALTAGNLMAQFGDGERPRRTPDAAIAVLNLSDAQVTALRDNQRARRQAMRTTMQEAAVLNRQLREEMAKDSPDTALVGQLTVDIKNKRAEIQAVVQQFHEQALALLDAEQTAALSGLEQARNAAREAAPAIQQATGLGLLVPPEQRGPGFRGPGGPRFRAAGFGGFRGRRGGHFLRHSPGPSSEESQ